MLGLLWPFTAFETATERSGGGEPRGGSEGGEGDDAGRPGQRESAEDEGRKDDDGDEKISISKSEWDSLQKERAQERRARREQERKDREREEREARDRGEHEKIAAREKERADNAEARLQTIERNGRITKVAKRMKFHDPDDAHLYLSDEQAETDASIERRLTELKTEKPRLFEEATRTGGDHTDRESSTDTSGSDDDSFGFERLRQVDRKND